MAFGMSGQSGCPAVNLREMGQTPETGPHEATALHLAPIPHPTPWGGFPTTQRTLGTLIYGLIPTSGPRGWVTKMGVQKSVYGYTMSHLGAG